MIATDLYPFNGINYMVVSVNFQPLKGLLLTWVGIVY